MKIKVETSARHVHLTSEDFAILFGDEERLDPIAKLSQEDDFAADKTVELLCGEKSIKNVRVIGPCRNYTQVELSKTDSIKLGINIPLKISGDLPGASIKIMGPKGEIEKDCAILAKRHLHLSPDEAEKLNLKNGDTVKIKMDGERALIFDQIVVRVKPNYTVALHLDTDEANSALIEKNGEGELLIQ